MGICKYCGQSHIVRDNDLTEEERNEQATLHCDCSEACAAAKVAEQAASAYKRIDQIFGNKAKENGFMPIKNDSAIDIMRKAVTSIVEDELLNITIQITGSCKAKISVNAKGFIKVARTDTNHYELLE